mmetsp:Transcript_21266/g.43738  ORF Transcript_21266/g.43738 Transcript_21266/m.43738 type:complete len:256 (-) Transcript_21266:6-773(-)
MVNQLGVSRQILGASEVCRRKDFRIFFDLDVGSGADPGRVAPIGMGGIGDGSAVGKLVDAVVQSHQNGRSGTIQGNQRGDLVSSGGSDQTRFLWPNPNHGAHGPVVVNDGGTIQGIPTNSEFALLTLAIDVVDNWIFFGGSLADDVRFLTGLPHEFVRNNIHAQLRISKHIGASFHRHKIHSEGVRNICTHIHHVLDNLLNYLIGTFGSEDLRKSRVGVFLFFRSVARGVRCAVVIFGLWRHLNEKGGNKCNKAP